MLHWTAWWTVTSLVASRVPLWPCGAGRPFMATSTALWNSSGNLTWPRCADIVTRLWTWDCRFLDEKSELWEYGPPAESADDAETVSYIIMSESVVCVVDLLICPGGWAESEPRPRVPRLDPHWRGTACCYGNWRGRWGGGNKWPRERDDGGELWESQGKQYLTTECLTCAVVQDVLHFYPSCWIGCCGTWEWYTPLTSTM